MGGNQSRLLCIVPYDFLATVKLARGVVVNFYCRNAPLAFLLPPFPPFPVPAPHLPAPRFPSQLFPPFFSLLHFPALPFQLFPSLPLPPLEVGPLNPARESGERCKLPSGSGAEPRPKSNLVHFSLKKLKYDIWWHQFQ